MCCTFNNVSAQLYFDEEIPHSMFETERTVTSTMFENEMFFSSFKYSGKVILQNTHFIYYL